ncbi:MAG: FAD-binding oxidoreductase [Methanomassiliicoccus sp.]|nr:FAD-binding oxidoreductase [Methanomassiliicoccus sp.]
MPGHKGSPWPEEYPRSRLPVALSEGLEADVAIVGGGISGLATAFYLVARTDLRVVVLESGLVGHGASGNNGGQAVEGSETGLRESALRVGEERAVRGFREMTAARGALDSVLSTIGANSLLTEVVGRLGLAETDDVEWWASELEERRRTGLDVGKVHVAEDAPVGLLGDAPRTPRAMLARQMWSRDRRYLASVEVKVGLVNTCALVEVLTSHLLSQPDRFRIFEASPVDLVRLSEEDATLRCNGHIILADAVVMCTNGYAMPQIEACSPSILGGRVRGVVGYMVGSEGGSGPEGARAYFPGGNEYYYLARRRFREGWLTAAGGPEGPITGTYDPGIVYHRGAYERLEEFLSLTMDGYAGPSSRRWQGLMGYTPTGARVVGQDPRLSPLYYNLGCNGIGILSAVAGARRLADLMEGEDVEPSLFDPEILSSLDPRFREISPVQGHRP